MNEKVKCFNIAIIQYKKEEIVCFKRVYSILGNGFDVDVFGCLCNFRDWNQTWSEHYFPNDQIINEKCWKVIIWLRNYYKQYNQSPAVLVLLENLSIDISVLIRIFPYEYQICRISGLPHN